MNKDEKRMLMTYEFRFFRLSNGNRIVAVESGDTYLEALDNVKRIYGADWEIEGGSLIAVNA